MTRLTLASTVALVCTLAMGSAPDARAQQRSIDNHGNWTFNFKSQQTRAPQAEQADRPRRARSARSKSRTKDKPDTLVRFADGDGRRYNPSSKVWFDGKGSCWSGKDAFTFKKGAWFYGDAAWTQSSTTWTAEGDEQPELVSCDSDPIFAANVKELAATTTGSPIGPAATATATPRSGGDLQKAGAKATGCRKYFANVGQMLTVPCGD